MFSVLEAAFLDVTLKQQGQPGKDKSDILYIVVLRDSVQETQHISTY